MFECEICGYETKQKGNLKQHRMNKHNLDVIWWECFTTGCGFKTKSKSSLKRHINNKHS